MLNLIQSDILPHNFDKRRVPEFRNLPDTAFGKTSFCHKATPLDGIVSENSFNCNGIIKTIRNNIFIFIYLSCISLMNRVAILIKKTYSFKTKSDNEEL